MERRWHPKGRVAQSMRRLTPPHIRSDFESMTPHIRQRTATSRGRAQRLLRLAGGLAAYSMTLAALPGAGLSADQIREYDAAIAKHRQGTLVIQAAPDSEVVVEQVRHGFWFGAALANQAFDGRMPPEQRDKYRAAFLTNFNSAVTENALKWHTMEPRRGSVDYTVVDAILAWTDQHQIPLRGHNLFWGIPHYVQGWLKELPDDDFRDALKNRALDIGRRYRGRFAEYDLNNEMIHGNYYEQRLGKEITLQMARWIRQEDPKAVLYLNDYDILTGVRLDDYVRHIRDLLSQGVPIGGIGVQGHLHGETFDPQALRRALDQLAQFNLPIRVTEFNMPGQRSRYSEDRSLRLTDDQEQAKARALADYYRICFAHPRVEGILMWGFWEGANWIPASSLYRRDWTPLPALGAYRDLVFGQWWTRWRGRTDAQGRCEIRAYYGKYRVTTGDKTQMVDFYRTP
jgi:GH35 family endo-1,4-beta-xylanase